MPLHPPGFVKRGRKAAYCKDGEDALLSHKALRERLERVIPAVVATEPITLAASWGGATH